jgi:DNA-binding IclR family transcriptional regulator
MIRPAQQGPDMGTVAKALDLLDHFTRQRPCIGLSDMARLSGTNKATCFRLLSEMQAFGLVEQDPESRAYRLGPAVLRLSVLREAAVPMRDATRPVLDRLSEATGESAHSSMLIGDRLQMMDFAYSNRHGTRVIFDDTDTLPFHATSSGLAVLAFLPETLREKVLCAPMAAVTPHTQTDAVLLRRILDEIRHRGFAEVDGGFEADVTGLAVPLFGPRGDCLGAVAVAAPSARVTPGLRSDILDSLKVAGAEIITLWGGTLPPEIAMLWHKAA